MSEAVMTPPDAPRPRVRSKSSHHSRLNALEALERGFSLFRSTFRDEAWLYYAGSAPLIFCSIPIWVVNGQIRVSNGVVLMEAALLVAAYLLRVCMVSRYMQCVREQAFGTTTSRPVGVAARAAAVARLLLWKSTLSAAALVSLPTVAGSSWFYSACQFASLEAQDDSAERHSFTGCLGIASQWFGSSLLLFLMLFPLWTAVWLNGLVVAMLVPQLLHSIFGVNSLLSTPLGMFALLQSSAFWLSLFAATWLALDPIVKCSFVIVYQHLRSLREGDDLRGLLASLPREQRKRDLMTAFSGTARVIGLLIVVAFLACASPVAGAQSMPQSPISSGVTADAEREARVQRLRQALDAESKRAIYQWHDADHPSPPNWFDKLLAKIEQGIERAWDAFRHFLSRLWPRGWSLGSEKGRAWQLKDLRMWLWLVAILTLIAGGVLFWLRRQRKTGSLAVAETIVPLPDLSDVATASERSEDEWFALAGRLEGAGDLRLALRAAYFGLLAGLAERKWVTIRRDRTNREYLDEFTRRWRRRPQSSVDPRTEITEKVRSGLRQFDRVWYGSHAVTKQAVTTYRQDQQELLNHV